MPNTYPLSVYKTQVNVTVLQTAHIVAQEVSHRPSPEGSEFNAGQLYMGFVMDKVAVGEAFTDYLDSFHLCCMFTQSTADAL